MYIDGRLASPKRETAPTLQDWLDTNKEKILHHSIKNHLFEPTFYFKVKLIHDNIMIELELSHVKEQEAAKYLFTYFSKL